MLLLAGSHERRDGYNHEMATSRRQRRGHERPSQRPTVRVRCGDPTFTPDPHVEGSDTGGAAAFPDARASDTRLTTSERRLQTTRRNVWTLFRSSRRDRFELRTIRDGTRSVTSSDGRLFRYRARRETHRPRRCSPRGPPSHRRRHRANPTLSRERAGKGSLAPSSSWSWREPLQFSVSSWLGRATRSSMQHGGRRPLQGGRFRVERVALPARDLGQDEALGTASSTSLTLRRSFSGVIGF
jgi:hypothetical protein